MKHFALLPLAAVLGACSAMPVQEPTAQGFYTSDTAEFAVFADAGQASAIRLGDGPQADMAARAVDAIQQATRCRVIPGSVVGDLKSVQARYVC